MKKITFFFVLLTICNSLLAQTVKFSSASPELGKVVKFIYNPKGGNLERLANISCNVKAFFNRDSRINIRVKLTKVGDFYEGEFMPKDSTHLAVLVFSADGTVDENPEGYFTKFYIKGVPTPMSLFLEGYLYAILGKSLSKIQPNLPHALSSYKQAFEADSTLMDRYLNNYLLVLYNIDKTRGQKAVMEAISNYNKAEVSEKNSARIATLYMVINDKAKADSVYSLIKTKFPKGSYALAQAISGLREFKDAEKKEAAFNQLLNQFNLSLANSNDNKRLGTIFFSLAEVFAAIDNFEKAAFYIDKYDSKLTSSIVYNKIAHTNAVAKKNLEAAERFSAKSMRLIDTLMQEETPYYYDSRADYLVALMNYQQTNTLTYITILSLLEKNTEALAIAEMAIKRINDVEMNTKYVSLLVKNGKTEEALKYAVQFIQSGQGNDEITAALKSVYKGSLPFDIFYSKLEKDAYLKQQQKLYAQMINLPAPKFTLSNLKGEQVSLDKLKGKVVVIDYWATWCGPCMQSFPSMQKALVKYKNDPSVIFLFINTWERGDQKKNVKAWATANSNYTFNILLDQKREDNSDEFDVVSKYKVSGIPTKFIIDGNGFIRFKTIGFDDTEEVMVRELSLMIDLAKSAKAKPQGK